MRTSMVVSLLAVSALLVVGCGRKSPIGMGGEDGTGAYGAGDDVVISGSAAGLGGDAAGAYGERFEDTRERVTDADLDALLFSFDSYTLPADELAKADAAAQYLMSHPSYVMIIEGHSDERGSNEYNLSLSEQRALGVKDYIVTLGIEDQRIQTRAFGEEKPADPGHNEAAYRLNRRAEFVPYK